MANDTSLLPSRVVTDYSLDTIRPHTFQVALEILHKYPVYFPWGEGGSGDHKAGKALDFPTYEYGGGVNKPGPLRVSMGYQLADELWVRRAELSVAYVIYRQHIISINPSGKYGDAGIWNEMEDRGDMTANHMDHVHVSFKESPKPFTWNAKDDEMTPEQYKAIMDKFAAADKYAKDAYGDLNGRLVKFEERVIGHLNTLKADVEALQAEKEQ